MGHEVAWLSGHKPTHPTALVGNKIEVEYLSNDNSDLIQIRKVGNGAQAKANENVRRRRPHMEDDLQILKVDYLSMLKTKTTSNVRQPQNIENGIAQQPLIGSYSSFKIKLKMNKKSN